MKGEDPLFPPLKGDGFGAKKSPFKGDLEGLHFSLFICFRICYWISLLL